jgi:hypothetical protein
VLISGLFGAEDLTTNRHELMFKGRLFESIFARFS